MFRIGIICCVWLLSTFNGARAESSAERGGYLVNTIMACGNCHTPRGADGKTVAERALSGGGLKFTTPAFVATAPNITPDVETGIGSWSDAEIKQALIKGLRPDHGHLAGAPLAAIMPANFYQGLLPDDLDAIVQRPRRLDRSGNRPRHHAGNYARRADAEASDGLWLLCGTEGRRSGRYHRLSAHAAAIAMKPSRTAGSAAGQEIVFWPRQLRKRRKNVGRCRRNDRHRHQAANQGSN
jgi:mono/diheme cytochrome c family protein